MSTVQELLQRTLSELAPECQKLIQNPSADMATVREARKLCRIYSKIAASSSPTLEEEKRREVMKRLLKKRMAALLAEVLV